MGIKCSEVSIVVQGKIQDETGQYLRKLRNTFPEAEIVLSTWKGESVEGLCFDVLVLNDDPGGEDYLYLCDGKEINNQNRQVVSTVNGIRRASKKFVIKIRTDFTLTNNSILKDFNQVFKERDVRYKIFKSRIITCSLCSRIYSHQTFLPTPFHPSDIFAFGYRDDLLNLWESVGLATSEELACWPCKFPSMLPYKKCRWRYAPEQYIFIKCVEKKFGKTHFSDWTDFSSSNISLSKKIIWNNFIILDNSFLGLESEKHKLTIFDADNGLPGVISSAIYVTEFNKLFQTGILCNCFISQRKNLVAEKISNRVLIKDEIRFFLQPFRTIFRWIVSPLKIFALLLRRLYLKCRLNYD